MLSRIIAKKYAKALLGIGLDDGNYEALGQDLDKMADLLGESKDLRVVLRSPAFPKSARKTIARKIGERLGLATTTVKFIELLIHRKRMDHFFMITKTYRDLCDEVAGRTRVTLAHSPGASLRSGAGDKELNRVYDGQRGHPFLRERSFLDRWGFDENR